MAKRETEYCLDKLSKPGFELYTTDTEMLLNVLRDNICKSCKNPKIAEDEDPEEIDFMIETGMIINQKEIDKLHKKKEKISKSYNDLLYSKDSKEDMEKALKKLDKKLNKINLALIYCYLNTSCGAEFFFNKVQRDEDGKIII